jgi:hypothetical protein
MKTAGTSLLLTLTLGLVSCSSTGGPSGSLVGLITGGVLGAAGDEYLYNDDDNGTGTSSSSNGTSSGTGGTVVGGSPPLLSSDVTTTTTDENGLTTTESTKTNNSFLTEGLGGNNNTNNNQSTLDRHRGLVTGAVAGLAAGAVSDMFRKNEVQKKYDEGYAKAKSDAIKEFYWIKRDAEKKKNGGDDPPVQYRYYEVEVPAHITSDGVFIDRHKRVIEVVE